MPTSRYAKSIEDDFIRRLRGWYYDGFTGTRLGHWTYYFTKDNTHIKITKDSILVSEAGA